MNHLEYYRYQTEARNVKNIEDVRAIATSKDYLYRRIILPHLQLHKNARIAELACGHGSFLYWLKTCGYEQVTGIDSSPEQVSIAREVSFPVEQCDVLTWLAQQPASTLDIAVGIDLVEHLSKDDFMTMLMEANRVLRTGGRLILRYPNGDSPFVGLNLFNDITHVWTYTTNCINTLSKMHRFTAADFIDESHAALRDMRWLKVPLSKIAITVLRLLVRAATREDIRYWSPHIWAFLTK